ncbi:MAG: hypothetical protein A3A51_00655 [Candidatus Levybacteria bacterium RIFCSPLOWO2_01_FULL_39_10]|nr:MAG: hypothetical protein A3A51_00655 [Candidatus Levybacteria bacterium RIFCSPLOWO2_01_FULL_39_10]
MKLSIFNSARNREKEEKQLDQFITALLEMDSKEKMKDFLEGILTPKELQELPHRLGIVKMLKRGISQHDVAGKLGVGIATVSRGSRELQKGKFKYV